MRLYGNNRIGGIRLSRAWLALSPAPAPSNHQSAFVGKNHLSLFRVFLFLLAKNGVALCAVCEMHSDCSLDCAYIKYSDWESIPNANQVTDIDQHVDAWDIAFLSQTT